MIVIVFESKHAGFCYNVIMIWYDSYGVKTVFYCSMQTFSTTNTIKIELFIHCTYLCWVAILTKKKINE